MDERQRIVKQTFTKEQLSKMSIDELITLVGKAGPNAKIKGTAVVRKANGNIKYDDDATPGKYHELDTPED